MQEILPEERAFISLCLDLLKRFRDSGLNPPILKEAMESKVS